MIDIGVYATCDHLFSENNADIRGKGIVQQNPGTGKGNNKILSLALF